MYSVTLNTFVDTNNYKITSLLCKRTMCVCAWDTVEPENTLIKFANVLF